MTTSRQQPIFWMALMAMILVVAGIASAASAGSSRGLLGVDEDCIASGNSIPGACSTEINQGLSLAGITADTSNIVSLASALQQANAAGKTSAAASKISPGTGCCAAICKYATNSCPCNAKVNELLVSLKVDSGTVNSFVREFANKCGCPSPC